MASQINLADKETLDTVNANVSTVKTDVGTVNTNIGAKADTAATAVNTTNSVFANIKGILTKALLVGANTDAAGTTTIFARLNQIYTYLVSTIYAYLANTLYAYLTANMSATRMAKIDTIAASSVITNSSVVKSVQRGTFNFGGGSSVAITISSVTPSKCDIMLYGSVFSSSNAAHQLAPYVSALSNTVLTIGLVVSSSNIAGYQIVEYY